MDLEDKIVDLLKGMSPEERLRFMELWLKILEIKNKQPEEEWAVSYPIWIYPYWQYREDLGTGSPTPEFNIIIS